MKSEEHWSDSDKQLAANNFYGASKTLAEKTAIDFVNSLPADQRFRLVSTAAVRTFMATGTGSKLPQIVFFFPGAHLPDDGGRPHAAADHQRNDEARLERGLGRDEDHPQRLHVLDRRYVPTGE